MKSSKGVKGAGKNFKAAGDLDSSFGEEGKLIITLPDGRNFFAGSILLPNGSIVSAGREDDAIVMFRHFSEGQLDPGFGEQGMLRFVLLPGMRLASVKPALQEDGKILLYGSVGEESAEMIFVLRVLADGQYDTSFGDEGLVLINFITGVEETKALALQPDGKIVLVGRLIRGYDDYDALIVRLTEQGKLDQSFNGNGFILTGKNYLSGVVVLADSRLLFAGREDEALLFMCYLSSGQLDSNFGAGGVFTIKIPSAENSELTSLALDESEAVVATGWAQRQGTFTPLVTRILLNGTADKTFNDGAPVLEGFAGYEVQNMTVAIQTDRKIVVAGSSTGTAETSNFALMRFYPDGSLDRAFGTQGRVMTDFGGADIRPQITLQSDGKVLLFGTVLGSSDRNGHAIARYLST